MPRPARLAADLSAFPDLVVIYLGMRVRSPRGALTTIRLGRAITQAVAAEPDGLLLHENVYFSPVHAGMRQYWRDFDALEAWTRTLPHRAWWRDFLRDPAGTGFWHELYSRRGGIEAIYENMPGPLGIGTFAPLSPARERMFSARGRLDRDGAAPPPVVDEREAV